MCVYPVHVWTCDICVYNTVQHASQKWKNFFLFGLVLVVICLAAGVMHVMLAINIYIKYSLKSLLFTLNKWICFNFTPFPVSHAPSLSLMLFYPVTLFDVWISIFSVIRDTHILRITRYSLLIGEKTHTHTTLNTNLQAHKARRCCHLPVLIPPENWVFHWRDMCMSLRWKFNKLSF